MPLVRQQITLEPMPDPVLFAVYPVFEANSDQPERHVQFDPERQQLVRGAEAQVREFDYELLTTGFSRGGQSRIVPQPTPMGGSDLDENMSLPDGLPDSSRLVAGGVYANVAPEERLTGLRALAAKTIRDANLADNDRYGKAKALEHMLSSPPFEYSLNRPPPAPNVDPIEDFVTRNRSGHCEYFASALALMLRSQGIPARVVIGFRGGEWNPLGSFLDVRQLHAHAWVEAYLEQDQIPANQRPVGVSVRHGAWLVLDATPAGPEGSAVQTESWLSPLKDMESYVAQLWNSYIIGLNPDRQERIVYQPLARAGKIVKSAWMRIRQSAQSAAAWYRSLWSRDEDVDVEMNSNWPMYLTLVLFAAGVIGIYRITRRSPRGKSKTRRESARAASGVSEVPFYRRFEALLAQRGLVRRAGQTQREFAQAAAAVLPDAPDGQPAGPLARRIVEAYYRVRFGRAALDSRQAAAVEQLLVQLQTAVVRRPKRGRRRQR
jgi:hypothetical protein